MKGRLTTLGIGIFLLLSTFPVAAKKMNDLYQAQVKIDDRSQKNWKKGVEDGLSQVFVKVSGNNQVATIPQIKDSLDNAEKFVQSFGYKSKHSNTFLMVDFSEKQVRKVLREARQSLWGEDRPETIIWFSRQAHNHQPEMVGVNHSDLSRAIFNHAVRRGIPVKLPALDQNDQNKISVQEMMLLNDFALQRASKRYDTEAVLGVRIVQNIEDEWDAHCRLFLNGQTIEWRDQANSEEVILSQIIDRLASELADEVLALRYHASQERVDLEIQGVHGLEDYVEAVQFVKHLLPVTDVEVVGIKADVLKLNVLSGGGVSGLSEAINHAKQKKLEIGSDADIYNRNLLIYKWLSRNSQADQIKENNNRHQMSSAQEKITRVSTDEIKKETLEIHADKNNSDSWSLKIQEDIMRLR